ncbi:ribonucleotide reductase subunit alpha [Pseudidiomarina terrestris]|uniref:Ribonucleotide reductase subunit alpha n=1 Tax=Pseudidiomarina terrestris TaxID=2820060 RepID=A0AAW7R0X6_9GAMM|nr:MULTISPECIES: ribonucleotide reductase subunit alpha [unclassified Pseudidiomarina]MDN7124758.1 ribonucleotide reductase subunit alpha [Pseudidiomarina sp. 1APP75-32.1]MDN7125815.1 ribonucleotide reductase subunit alpha [Pseudidiomarina sp. 1APR75-33.1]MDN7129768.1 ribonucleotide reductase subunit alpha [Pseudidiomarina sp. 1APR75-15]MDN7136454.1 ribonucleotide reductase subunit alpha [Pseudidiomarina sp. 1ASP75-5]MDN7137975.1 ribonucleotide reductase subunit alpha [Pseudidiomarina sp. 1ASP
MVIESYSDLIQAAQQQDEPQRLLFVLAKAELPDDATESQKSRYAEQQGGALDPVLCVDKLPQDVAEFSTLLAESERTGVDWDIAFIASMSGRAGQAPSSDEADQPLTLMVNKVKAGSIADFVTVNKQGELIQLFA